MGKFLRISWSSHILSVSLPQINENSIHFYTMKTTRSLGAAAMAALALGVSAQNTPKAQMELLDRGLVAVPAQTSGILISWRLLGYDDASRISFDLLRNGEVLKAGISNCTNYLDGKGTANDQYQIVTRIDGEVVETSDAVNPWGQPYMTLQLNRPAGGSDYSYSPNDCSVGDVDGDGQYEIFVKWDPSNSKDNSQDGITGNVFLDCYRLDGTQLWRVDLGKNIRAGAHYTQYLVWDFDGDGRAEMMCKTAPGTKDGTDAYVSQAATDTRIQSVDDTKNWQTSKGRINGGHEYLTVFEGLTGRAIHTIAYNPNRNAKSELSAAAGTYNWDDRSGKNDKGDYGNRGERYLATVAALDGPTMAASAVFCRGYYTYAYLWAVDYDGQQLRQRWLHRSDSKTKYSVTDYTASAEGTTQSYTPGASKAGLGKNTMYGNGNHNLSAGDVDGDGKDEIVWGSATVDDNGQLLYSVGFGHGDAMHMGDLDPSRPGLEVFQVHEEKGTYSWHVHDAATGEILFKGGNAGKDNGRGIAAQLSSKHDCYFFSSSDDRQQRSAATGEVASTGSTSVNFRIYWDGDLQDELLDGTKITKWNGNGTSTQNIKGKSPDGYNASQSCNSTKATPNLLADIFGDWREELILWSGNDNATLNIFTANTSSNNLVPTLMHDHVYRLGIAWQNVAYNQPPHLGYFLPHIDLTGISTVHADESSAPDACYDLMGRRTSVPAKGLGIEMHGDKAMKTYR